MFKRPKTSAQKSALQAGTRSKKTTYRQALAGMKRPVVIAFGLSALVNLLMLTSSIYMLQVYDRVLPSRSVETLMGLFVIVGLLFGFLFLFDMLRKRLMSRMAMQFDTDLSVSAFETAMGTQSRPGGDTPGRRAQPVLALNTVRGFLTGPCVIALLDLPFMPIFLVLLFIVHPLLGWITLAGAGVAVLLAFGNWAMTRRATQINGALDGQEAVLRDRALAGTEALQAMGIGPAITQRWHAKRQQALAAGQLGTDLSDTFATASKSFRMFLQSAILSVAALLVIREEISAGMIIASSILSGRALGPIDQLIGQWRGLGRAWQSHKTLSQVLRGTGACDRSASKLPIDAQIDVVRVTKYASGAGSSAARPLLSAIEFSISGGDAVCLLGESGSGKSLLMRVLVDGVVPDAGDIRFGGVTRAQMTPDQIGRKIGYLPQDIAVVPGTVAEFISRLQADGEDDKVVQAATQAGVHRAILALPDGYDTQIGGASDVFLSAGQMQLLGLARAIYGHPKFVILDDPEPRLDSAGKQALNDAIADLRARGCVVLIAAQRIEGLSAINKILPIEAGRVAPLQNTVYHEAPPHDTPDAVVPDGPASPANPASRASRATPLNAKRKRAAKFTHPAPHTSRDLSPAAAIKRRLQ